MSEEKLTSNKLDIQQRSLNNSNSKEDICETYKKILSEDSVETAANNIKMGRENSDHVDGADERMLGSGDKETLALKDLEVKFIPANPNGDAQIEMDSGEKTFSGMTKEELMKYANDPFWVKLRWFLFILFWAAWVGMLVGAIMIIINAPKCAAPTPLSWYKEGPLVKVNALASDSEIEDFAKHEVRGVIYELPGNETYFVDNDEIQKRIKDLVEKYKAKDIHVVIDLTPNYVTKEDELFKNAFAGDSDSRKAFVTSDTKLNWKKVGLEADAFEDNNKLYYLKQFGDYYDIRLNHPVAKNKFMDVLSKLASYGVKGFRLDHARHYIVQEAGLTNEKPNLDVKHPNSDHYDHFHHLQSTYQPGLGELLQEFNNFVKNITNHEGFMTVKDDLSQHMDKYAVNGVFGFEVPRFGFINIIVNGTSTKKAQDLKNNFDSITNHIPSMDWMQIEYSPNAYVNFNEIAFKLFVSLMNGVQVSSYNDLVNIGNGTDMYSKIQKEHKTQVFQHGDFMTYLSFDNQAFAYSRKKSGNPGYFVVMNPLDHNITANFNTTKGIGSELTYLMASYDETPKKVQLDKFQMPKHSTAIFTFVPEKND